MRLKRWFALLFLIFLSLVFLSGCDVGLGIKFEVRLGMVYFVSAGEDVYGKLELDGREVGYLDPGGQLQALTTLDFKHKVSLECGYCGETHSFIVYPPLIESQVIPIAPH